MEPGEIVRRERRKRGLSQKELAEALGLSTSYIGMIEVNRRNASDEAKRKIARYFGLSIEYIFFNDFTTNSVRNHKQEAQV